VRASKKIDTKWLRANIEQLVGEAAVYEQQGQTFWLPEAVWDTQREITEKARVISEVETAITEHLAETEHTRNAFITAHELTLLIEGSTRSRSNLARGAYMEKLGFEDVFISLDGKARVRVWVRNRSDFRLADIPRKAARYHVHKDANGAAVVRIRNPIASPGPL